MTRPFPDRPPAPTITVGLRPHPSTAQTPVGALRVSARVLEDGSFAFAFRLEADPSKLRIPAPQPAAAADELWQHTCFEVFVGVPGEPGYREFNLSPSGRWAAYVFTAGRERDTAADAGPPPLISFAQTADGLGLDAVLAAAALPACAPGTDLQVGVSAVVEAADGTLSHWALHHPADTPDFHHRDSFAMVLTTPKPKAVAKT